MNENHVLGTLWRLHDDDALRQLDEAAVSLLTRKGCRIEHEGLLTRLAAAGCRVDMAANRCLFPERLIREAVAHVSGNTGAEVARPDGAAGRRLSLMGSHPHFLDWPSGERRLATRADIVAVAKMGHMLDEFATVGRALTCAEVDPRLEPLWTTLTLAEITDKPIGGGEIFYPHTIEPLVRMGEVLSGTPGDTSLIASCDLLITPLIFDRLQAECFLEKRRLGIANVPGTMPISGLSAPVTLAGTVAVAVAELLAGWTMGYVVAPDLPVGGIAASGSLDMRTASACFGSPEALLQDITTVQVCRRLYGITIWPATSYVDCKFPGMDAALQKLYPLVAIPFGGNLNLAGDGLLSAGQDYAPVQHLLELEIMQALDRFWRGFEINEETLALDLIAEMLDRPTTNFLDTPHTRRHYRREQWYPRWLEHIPWQGTAAEIESEAQLLARLDRHWKDAVARYTPPARDPRQLAELRQILAAVDKSL